MLYPLKFCPIYKSKIWGGEKLKNILNKKDAPNKCGESWELSAIENNVSIVQNGYLKGKNLSEIIENYKEDMVGQKVYNKYKNEFPLLIKFIDANDDLSIQVHPDDELAKQRHNSQGKTEMWYIIESENKSKLISGFNKNIDKNVYLKHLHNNTLMEILNTEDVSNDDVFFIPAGRVHSTGQGILFAEIQQTSDITYRIFDWNRCDEQGNPRELHTEQAIDAIDYKHYEHYKTSYEARKNKVVNIVNSKYFTTNILCIDRPITQNYINVDSFVIYICLSGKCQINYDKSEHLFIEKGETLLIPAILKDIEIIPAKESKILEVFV